jgi:hypothetical protein
MSLLSGDMRVCRASLHPPYAQEIPGAEPAPLGDRIDVIAKVALVQRRCDITTTPSLAPCGEKVSWR